MMKQKLNYLEVNMESSESQLFGYQWQKTLEDNIFWKDIEGEISISTKLLMKIINT